MRLRLPSILAWIVVVLCVPIARADEELEAKVPESLSLADNPRELVTALKFIASEHKHAIESVESFSLRGWVLPQKITFLCAVQGDKQRYEQHQTFDGVPCPFYELSDGATRLRMNVDSIDLEPADRVPSRAQFLNSDKLRCLTSIEVQGLQSVDESFNEIADLLMNTEIPDEADVKINLTRNGHIITLTSYSNKKELKTDEGEGVYLSLVLDASQGYQLTDYCEKSWSTEDPENTFYSETEKHITYQHIGGKAFVVAKGTRREKCSGAVAERQQSAGEFHETVKVEAVKFGDLGLPEDFFSYKSLPIKVGMKVHDHRGGNKDVYTYDRFPFAENVLARVSAKQSAQPDAAGGQQVP